MKLRRKLLAAGFALGATALTLTTSTFAWYTANTEVSMTGVHGMSASAGDSNLLISSVSTQGTFGSSTTLSVNTTGLQPVQYNSNASGAPTWNFIQKTDTTDATGTGVDVSTAATSNVLYFDLYFKAASAKDVYFDQLTVTNTTTSLPTKDVLTTAGLPSSYNAENNPTYTVNVLRVLKMAWYTEAVKSGADPATPSATQARKLDNLVDFTAKADSITSGWNAHEYFNAASGAGIATTGAKAVDTAFDITTPAKPTTGTPNTSIKVGTTPAGLEKGTYLHMYVYFFIDGWDVDCFDAVQGQTFDVSMKFSSKDDTTLSA